MAKFKKKKRRTSPRFSYADRLALLPSYGLNPYEAGTASPFTASTKGQESEAKRNG